MLWILLGALIASRATVGPIVLESTATDRQPASAKPLLALAAIAALVAAGFSEGYFPLVANRTLARLDSSRAPVSANLPSLELLARSPAHQTAHTPLEMGNYLTSLRPLYGKIRKDPREREAMDRAFNASFAMFAREIQRDGKNDRLYTHAAELFGEAAQFYDSDVYRQKAIDAFHTAIELSPRRIEQSIGLASLYMKSRDYERAIVVLADAVEADPMLGEPRYQLAQAYIAAGKSDAALTMLQTSLGLGYVGAPEIYLTMGRRLEFAGRTVTAASLYSGYLEAKYTEAVWDGTETIDGPIPSSDIAVAAHLPLLYMRARESELAVKSAAALSAFDPSRTPLVDRFVSDVGARRRANWIAKTSLLPCASARNDRARDSTAFNACGVFRRKL
jgi:tetratricopeptide (TPR) repeat protein